MSALTSASIGALGLAAVLLLWILWLRRSRRKGLIAPVSTLAVLGSGGHTMEMLEMTKGLDSNRYAPLHFVLATTDRSSEKKVRATDGRQPDAFHFIPRSREVGQSYLSSVLTTLNATRSSWALVWRLQPDLILCNGPGTCLPLYLGAFLLKLFWKPQVKLVFVESFCRVKTLSLTGKIIYSLGISDEFVVHWPELREVYHRAKYLGQLF